MAIHHDTAEREQEAVTQVNHQLLMQIKVLQEVHQRVIELGTRETQVDTSFEVNRHPVISSDIRFQLQKMRFKVTSPHGKPKSFRADSSRKRAGGHLAATHKNNTLPTIEKTENTTVFTP